MGEQPKPPRAPLVPRVDASSPPPPDTENVGRVPSIRVPVEDDRIPGLQAAMIQVQTDVAGLKTQMQAVPTQIDERVKSALTAEMTGVNEKLNAIGVETFNQSGLIKRTLDIVKRDRQDSISDAVDELTLPKEKQKLTAAEQKIFDGKGRRTRLWIKSAATLVFILVVIGSALGINRCNHVHGIEIPG